MTKYRTGHSTGLFNRRYLLATTTLAVVVLRATAWAAVVHDSLPWKPGAGSPPVPVIPGPWVFFTADEATAVEALMDRIIPPDPETPGGKDAGCAVFIDRQLAGPYGSAQTLYMRPPFVQGTPQQGNQSPLTPAELYRKGLAALDQYCRKTYNGAAFASLTDAQKDEVLTGLDKGDVHFDAPDAKTFFKQLVTNAKEGFFADPLYGGNRNMVGWKMIGFPGARYDYRDWIGRHNERYPLPPVGIFGRGDWSVSVIPASASGRT